MKPYFTLSKGKILEQYDRVRKLCDVVSYSSKTNPLVTGILEKNRECMFSVHLVNELRDIENMSRVLFLAQAWDSDLIGGLLERGVRWFAVDNESDLDVFLEFLVQDSFLKMYGKVNLLLRLRMKENTLRTEKFFVFGMRSEIVKRRIIEIGEKCGNMIGELGIHFHRKTQNMAEWNLRYEISSVLSKETLEKISVVNIGGGLPSEYANTNVKVLQPIFTKIMEFKDWLSSHNIKMMIEPGRFIAAPAGKLYTQILGVHEKNIIVNASVYNSDMDALIVPVKLKVEGELARGEAEAYVIKGVTPCSLDLFRYRVYLKDVNVGDSLVFLNAGAYNFSTSFCNLEKLDTRIEQ